MIIILVLIFYIQNETLTCIIIFSHSIRKLARIMSEQNLKMVEQNRIYSDNLSKHFPSLISSTDLPLRKWLLAKRDSSKAMDFFKYDEESSPTNQPPMGIKVRDAIVVELPNDRTENYIRAIREQIKSSLQLVVIIFPSSRDDRYSSLNFFVCSFEES